MGILVQAMESGQKLRGNNKNEPNPKQAGAGNPPDDSSGAAAAARVVSVARPSKRQRNDPNTNSSKVNVKRRFFESDMPPHEVFARLDAATFSNESNIFFDFDGTWPDFTPFEWPDDDDAPGNFPSPGAVDANPQHAAHLDGPIHPPNHPPPNAVDANPQHDGPIRPPSLLSIGDLVDQYDTDNGVEHFWDEILQEPSAPRPQ